MRKAPQSCARRLAPSGAGLSLPTASVCFCLCCSARHVVPTALHLAPAPSFSSSFSSYSASTSRVRRNSAQAKRVGRAKDVRPSTQDRADSTAERSYPAQQRQRHSSRSGVERSRRPTPAASAAFHAFLRQQNSPYVRASLQPTTAASDVRAAATSPVHQRHLAGGRSSEEEDGILQSSPVSLPQRCPEAAATVCGGERKLHYRSASDSPPEGSSEERSMKDEAGEGEEVLREWSLSPANLQLEKTTSTTRHSQDELPPSAQTSTSRRYTRQPDAQRRHRSELVERARRHTLQQLAHRHHRDYERTSLHAYELLKRVEGSLFHWSQQRRRLRANPSSVSRGDPYTSPNKCGTSSVHATENDSAEASGLASAVGDMDAVDARFFEYAGQIQRTLHQLTPRHFDAMRGHRLRRRTSHERSRRRATESATSSHGSTTVKNSADDNADASGGGAATPMPPPQLFHLRFLWRLLHITQLFYAIGRQASLPRTAVQTYVRSANCAYGIREILRVLGDELALISLGLSPASTGGSAAAAAAGFSRDELFQLFYAALCIPSEEAPSVPIYDPAALAQQSDRAGSASLLQFQADCVTTGAVAARMPMDEWCVRWWCHVYASYNAQSSSSPPSQQAQQQATASRSSSESGMDALLTMGQAMDVVRACLYATNSTHTTSSSSSARASPSFPVNGELTTPFMYFETPPRGSVKSHKASSDSSGRPFNTNSNDQARAAASPYYYYDNDDTAISSTSSTHQQPRGLNRRYRPRLVGALGGDRTLLRVPYHLGQRFVTVFLSYLLSSASAASTGSDSRTGERKNSTARGNVNGGPEAGAAGAALFASAAQVEAGMRRLLHRHGRDAVRDVALLCTAILYFEVFSASTAAFMAHAAPLCREQVELLSGHEISCVLLAYASLQRWEGRSDVCRRPPRHTVTPSPCVGEHKRSSTGGANEGKASGSTSTSVRSASAAATSGYAQTSSTLSSSSSSMAKTRSADARSFRNECRSSSSKAEKTSSSSAAFSFADSPSSSTWDLFYITLGSRAGQLSDTLSEEDVTRVLRAMELAGLEHDDLRRALESSLRMRNLGRRMLYET